MARHTAVGTKKPGENYPIGFRYQPPDLPSGVTISSVEMTVPAGITEGTSGVIGDGTEVYCWLSGGSDGEDYMIRFKSTLSDTKVLIDDYLIKVRD